MRREQTRAWDYSGAHSAHSQVPHNRQMGVQHENQMNAETHHKKVRSKRLGQAYKEKCGCSHMNANESIVTQNSDSFRKMTCYYTIKCNQVSYTVPMVNSIGTGKARRDHRACNGWSQWFNEKVLCLFDKLCYFYVEESINSRSIRTALPYKWAFFTPV